MASRPETIEKVKIAREYKEKGYSDQMIAQKMGLSKVDRR